jgi:diacylglycerol kinase (ATP)
MRFASERGMNAPSITASTPIRLFLNPNARDGAVDRLRDAAHRALGDQAEVIETTSPEDSTHEIHRVCDEGGVVVAAGGDGTVHGVINALMTASSPAVLGLAPMGTSNNFCRDLQLPLDVDEALAVVRDGVPTLIDLIRITFDGDVRYCATVATAGNADRVIDGLADQDKQSWGAWCYLRAALPVMTDLKCYAVNVAIEGGAAVSMQLWNLIVANGRYAGGGLDVAPRAQFNDGLLDLVLISEGEGLELASLASNFLLGDYLEHDRVTFHQAKRIDITSIEEIRFIADGEPLSGHTFRFEAIPGALTVLLPPAIEGNEPFQAEQSEAIFPLPL